MKKVDGYWPLIGSNPTLYTRRAADVIIDTNTGKQYVRGPIVVFVGDEIRPQCIESSDHYKFLYTRKDRKGRLTTQEAVNEVYISTLLK